MSMTDGDKLPLDIRIRHNLKPGDIGYLIYLHGILYAEEYDWDHTFEAYVAEPLAEFARSQSERERIWIVEANDKIAGSIATVESSKEQAQLRFLLLHPTLRGHGIGRILIQEAIGFCRESGYRYVFLWTVSALKAAASLYRSEGFQLTEERTRRLWGAFVTEQRYDLKL